ncbi:TolC family protein [Ekhidna sp.]|uniref:TolC family protein n=1 Tax=Ekhidna sp. TaxID=2608089 RepID=UPI003CCB7FDD
MKRFAFIVLFISGSIFGQDSTTVIDTTYLSLEDVIKMTLSYHPVVKQANLLDETAAAVLREARGNLDPKLEADYSLKEFKEKEYYNLLNTSFKIPTWIGIDPKVEFTRNSGEFLNPQNFIKSTTDDFGNVVSATSDVEQVTVGVSVPLGKGLFFDERRNAIRKAEAFSQIAEAEQIKEVNKILFTVIKDYWNWYLASKKQALMRQAIVLAQNLFDRTLIDYEFGEAAVVDTLQAKINFQKRTVDYRKATLEFELAKLNLSKHLWSENLATLELLPGVLPDSTSLFATPKDEEVKESIEFALTSNPEISKLEGKRNQLNADMRWARESIKPQIDLSYSFIDAPINPELESSTPSFGDNYKMGLDFSFPILLRKERGKIQQTQLKLRSNEFQMAQSQVVLKNEVLGAYAQSVALQDLLDQYLGVSNNYQRLLAAEIINLQNGETDLFKLNIQQDKYIEAQTEYYEAFTKWEKSKAEFYHVVGLPVLGLGNMFGFVTNTP